MSRTPNTAIAVIGIDIGKNTFHVVSHDGRGAIVLRQKWSRGRAEARLANIPSCLIGMEACVGAHQDGALSRAPQIYADGAPMQRQNAAAFHALVCHHERLDRRGNQHTDQPMAGGERGADRQAAAPAHRRGQRQGEPAAPGRRAAGWRRGKAVRREAMAGAVAPGVLPDTPEKRTGKAAAIRRRRARHAAVLADRARQYQVSLAARRYRKGRDDVLRRRCGAAGLLPASLAASAGQSRVTLTPNQRRDLLRIEQGRDPAAIAAAITAVRRDNPDADLLEIEQMLRAAASSAFVIATDDGFRIVIGMQAWVAELNALGRSPEGNRALLAAR